MAYTIKPKSRTSEYLYVFIQYPGDVGGTSYEFHVADGRIKITDAGGFRILYLKSVIKLLKKAKKADPALAKPEEFDWVTDETAVDEIPTFTVSLFKDAEPEDYMDTYKYIRLVYSRTGDTISIFITGHVHLTLSTWELEAFLKTLKTIQKSLETSE